MFMTKINLFWLQMNLRITNVNNTKCFFYAINIIILNFEPNIFNKILYKNL